MNNFLDKMTNFIDSKLTPPLIKFGNNKYMVAIRNALIRLIPLLIVGSFPMILTNLPITSLAKVMAPYNDAINTLSNMTFGFISLFLAFGIGSELADTYGLDAWQGWQPDGHEGDAAQDRPQDTDELRELSGRCEYPAW